MTLIRSEPSSRVVERPGSAGYGSSAPARLEVAAATAATARILAGVGHVVVHTPVLPTVDRKNVPVLADASVLVHLATRPTQVRTGYLLQNLRPDIAEHKD